MREIVSMESMESAQIQRNGVITLEQEEEEEEEDNLDDNNTKSVARPGFCNRGGK